MAAADVGGGFWREKQFRLVTSAATALATIRELTLQRFERAGKKAIALFRDRSDANGMPRADGIGW